MTNASDPLDLRGDAPLLDAYLRFLERAPVPFSVPGHKGRLDLVGSVVAGDVPLYEGLDSVGLSDVLAVAEERAARLWGVDLCRFSVGGSTHGNQALALAIGRPGDRVVVSRTLHRSLLLGLVLAGLEPVWVRPRVDAATGLPNGVAVDDVAAALRGHPDAVAVLLGDPSYVGTLADVAGHAAVAHEHGVPLVVDAAWAAHFGFHPSVPPHALACGADAIVTSAHKMLPSRSQAALVLARSERIDPARFERAFEATHTTSPAGGILASIDASRALLERDGEALLGGLLALVASARERLSAVPGLAVLCGPSVDPTKLVVLLPGTGASGLDVEADLLGRGITLEMADRDTLIPIVTVADTEATVGRLVEALVEAVEARRGRPRAVVPAAAWIVEPVAVLPPREAFFAPHETVPAAAAVGRVSAELVAPYPPGIPVLSPGELISAEALDALRRAHADGVRIAYAADRSLATLQVVASSAAS